MGYRRLFQVISAYFVVTTILLSACVSDPPATDPGTPVLEVDTPAQVPPMTEGGVTTWQFLSEDAGPLGILLDGDIDSICPVITISDDEGNSIGSQGDCGLVYVELPASGTYTVTAVAAFGDSSAGHNLVLSKPVSAGTLKPYTRQQVPELMPGQAAVYYFTPSYARQAFSISAWSEVGSTSIEVWGNEGHLLNTSAVTANDRSTPVEFREVAGHQILIINTSDGQLPAGSTWMESQHPTYLGELAVGQTTEHTLQPGEELHWKVPSTSDTTLSVTVDSPTGCSQVRLRPPVDTTFGVTTACESVSLPHSTTQEGFWDLQLMNVSTHMANFTLTTQEVVGLLPDVIPVEEWDDVESENSAEIVATPQSASFITHPHLSRETLERANQQCNDVLFIGLRGSGQDSGHGPQVWSSFRDIQRVIGKRYDLGQMTIDQPDYFAHDVESTLFTNPSAFFQGLEDGVRSLKAVLEVRHQLACREIIVLAGYSQGAMVVHRALLDIRNNADLMHKIGAVILIADGDRHIEEKMTTFGSAGRDLNGISYSGVIAKHISRARGLIFDSAWAETHMQSVCNQRDAVCDHFSPAHGWRTHVGYTNTEAVRAASVRAANLASVKLQIPRNLQFNYPQYVSPGETITMSSRSRCPMSGINKTNEVHVYFHYDGGVIDSRSIVSPAADGSWVAQLRIPDYPFSRREPLQVGAWCAYRSSSGALEHTADYDLNVYVELP